MIQYLQHIHQYIFMFVLNVVMLKQSNEVYPLIIYEEIKEQGEEYND